MPTAIETLRDKAKAANRRIIFPETHDERVVEAINIIRGQGLVQCIAVARGDSKSIPNSAKIVSIDDDSLLEQCTEQYVSNRAHKGLAAADAETAIRKNPLLFAALLVKIGVADGCVAGSIATTADVLRAGIQGVGTGTSRLVSSFFLMELNGRAMTYADCGVIPDPDAGELAQIAMASAESHEKLTAETPRVAMLSFSTKGSANHPRVEKVREALSIVNQTKPELLIDGELQFDAAFVADVAKRKAPGSEVAGQANVFIFPDLDSGNIAYKITQRLAGATALGPLVQGLEKPCMDLSRGCTPQDIADVAVIAAVLG